MSVKQLRPTLAALAATLLASAQLGDAAGRLSAGGVARTSLSVETSLDPNPAFFGDAVIARVAVTVEGGSIRPGSLKLRLHFGPFAATRIPSSAGAGAGGSAVYRYELQCLGEQCLPGSAPKRIVLPPVLVSASAPDGTRLSARAAWQPAVVLSRLTKGDLAKTQPPFRWPAALPPPAYAISPGLLVGLSAALAGLLALAALSLFVPLLQPLARRVRGRPPPVALDPLAAAIAYTREAAKRPDQADRRKAIGLLARRLEAVGEHALAEAAETAAWSESPPSPGVADGIADEVERELEVERR